MLVGAVLAGALDTKFALNLWVQENAFLAVGACREVFAVFLGVDEGAFLVRILAVGEMQAPNLLLLLAAHPAHYGLTISWSSI